MHAYACTHTPLSHSHPPALVLVWFEYLIYTLFWLSWSISFLFSDAREKSFYSKFLTLTLEVARCVMWVSARTVVFCICFASSCVQIPQNVTSHSFLYTALRVYWFRLRLFKFIFFCYRFWLFLVVVLFALLLLFLLWECVLFGCSCWTFLWMNKKEKVVVLPIECRLLLDGWLTDGYCCCRCCLKRVCFRSN